ncbi:MAG: glycine--tRNA ligase [Patescibacteria group bacterium]
MVKVNKTSSVQDKMEKIVSLAKRRGFIFPSSEIYGGLNSCYDYGPLGVELKNNIKKAWWKTMVQQHQDIVGLDSAILMHPKVWEASGHIQSFTDPLVDCKSCKKRFRADHLLEDFRSLYPKWDKEIPRDVSELKCPECNGELTGKRDFNLMFKTFMGPVEGDAAQLYLRPETAQGIYVDYDSVVNTTRQKIPFGIAQIGKAFRNEITPGNFIFRTREFEQMEMQWFINSKDADKWFEYWLKQRQEWYKAYGIKSEHLNIREHKKDELAHYAKRAVDIDYRFPFAGDAEFKELEGVHNRGDWDLSRHEKFSGKELKYHNTETGEKYTPWVIETSGGADRATLAFLVDAYTEIEGGRTTTTESTKETEVVLKLHKDLAPYKAAVLPLSKKPELSKVAQSIWQVLSSSFMVDYDEISSIGRRYRRQDEIGTPYCVTVDFESLTDNKVTVRDRDTMKQERVVISDLLGYFNEKYSFI